MNESDAEQRVSRVLKNKWRLDGLIGVGGMAAVYEATHRNGMKAAVKVLRRELSWEPEVRARFLREGYVANTVDHPGAVRVFDDDIDDDGSVFLVMELLLGESLEASRVRRGGRLPPAEAVRVASAMLDVLAAAHDKGIVHRDIKPENVFITRDGAVKLLDFGIARVRVAQQSNKTQTGILLGTPAFMAPEQARGQWEDVDGRTDIWAVGATLFTMLSGQPVHAGRSTTEALVKALTEPAPPLGSKVPTLAPALCEVVDRALLFERDKRWANAREMQQALQAIRPEDLPTEDEPTTLKTAPPSEALIAALTPTPRPGGPTPSSPGATPGSNPGVPGGGEPTASRPRFEIAPQTGPLPGTAPALGATVQTGAPPPSPSTTPSRPGSRRSTSPGGPGGPGGGVALEDTLPLSAVKLPLTTTVGGREITFSASLDVPARPAWQRWVGPGAAAVVILGALLAWLALRPAPAPAGPTGPAAPQPAGAERAGSTAPAAPGGPALPVDPARPASPSPSPSASAAAPGPGAPGPTAVPSPTATAPARPAAGHGAAPAAAPEPTAGSPSHKPGATRPSRAPGGSTAHAPASPARPRPDEPAPREPARKPAPSPAELDLHDSRR